MAPRSLQVFCLFLLVTAFGACSNPTSTGPGTQDFTNSDALFEVAVPKSCSSDADCQAAHSCHSSSCDLEQGICVSKLLDGWCYAAGQCYAAGASPENNLCQVCEPGTDPVAMQPVSCPLGESCDPKTGQCKQDSGLDSVGQDTGAWDVTPADVIHEDVVEDQADEVGSDMAVGQDGSVPEIIEDTTHAGDVVDEDGGQLSDLNDEDGAQLTDVTDEDITEPGDAVDEDIAQPGDVVEPECMTDEECKAGLGAVNPCEAHLCIAGSCQTQFVAAGAVCGQIADNPCLVLACDSQGTCQEENAADGTPCDDGNLLTEGDQCVAGSCTGKPIGECLVDSDCPKDDDLCNGALVCVGGDCKLDPGSVVTCPPDDDTLCLTNQCVPTTGLCVMSAANPGASCDDSNGCTGQDVCVAGICKGKPIECDDQNPCTVDGCDPDVGCTHGAGEGSCDDGDQCTGPDQCANGKCWGPPIVCDDGEDCTDDSCDPIAGCLHTPNTLPCQDANSCTKDDVCQNGTCAGTPVVCDDANPCTADLCQSDSGCVFEPIPGECDDGDACTADDHCQDGTCTGTSIICSDGIDCTQDSCIPESGCVHTPSHTTCDDEVPCTTDTCSAQLGCQHEPHNGSCDDGTVCNGIETCDAVSGCLPGVALDCDDENLCTDDSCDPVLGCINTANAAPCEDGNKCTVADSCSGGACQPGDPVDCDDGNACTQDVCVPEAGCNSTPLQCGDGDPCTNDYCDPTIGCVFQTIEGCTGCQSAGDCTDGNACTVDVCEPNGVCGTHPVDCDDGNACTKDSCDPGTGCVNQNVSGLCDDQNACTLNACDPLVGCTSQDVSAGCDDGNECTADSCEPAVGCINEDVTAACDDSDACTVDLCDPTLGCQNLDASQDCDDSNLCTEDSCDPVEGCSNSDISQQCDDGDLCTQDSCEQANGCVNKDISSGCDDSNLCTVDSCVPAIGCDYEDISLSCDDGDACTQDFCSPELGCVNIDITQSCDDSNACTTDSCDAAIGCKNTDISSQCNDANVCTEDSCSPTLGCQNVDKSSQCDDKNACTNDSCDPLNGCMSVPKECGDGDPCTVDSCDSKTGCVHKPIAGCVGCIVNKDCEDGDACTLDLCGETGVCTNTAVSCDDNSLCTQDGCNKQTGCTHLDISSSCDDGNACTQDSCNPTSGCLNEASDNACSTGNACSPGVCGSSTPSAKTCAQLGWNPAVVGTPEVCGGSFDSSGECSGSQTLTGAKAFCEGTGARLCSLEEILADETSGTGCGYNAYRVWTSSRCGNSGYWTAGGTKATTLAHHPITCQEPSESGPVARCCGDVSAAPVPSCVSQPGPSCDDANACTDDTCDPAKGCVHKLNKLNSCDDSNACTSTQCAAPVTSQKSCVQLGWNPDDQGGPTVCGESELSDGCSGNVSYSKAASLCQAEGARLCTMNELLADEVANTGCSYNPAMVWSSSPCGSGGVWAVRGVAGAPVNSQPVCMDKAKAIPVRCCADVKVGAATPGCVASGGPDCDDGNPCTNDTCNPATGCMHTPNSLPCDDGNKCTTGDMCSTGVCVGGPAPKCDDVNPCTNDSCHPATGCVHAPNALTCDDGNACTTADKCSNGSCVGGPAPNCNDSNPCTKDSCSTKTGCTHVATGLACDDGNSCTTSICAQPTVSAKKCAELGWPSAPGSDLVCGESNIGGPEPDGCSGKTDPPTAAAMCQAAGGRLCTLQEVLAGVTKGSGCGYDSQRIWTSTPCGSNGFWTLAGASPSLGDYPLLCSSKSSTDAVVRCCADQEPTAVEPTCLATAGPACSEVNPCATGICDPDTGCGSVLSPGPCDDGNACTTTACALQARSSKSCTQLGWSGVGGGTTAVCAQSDINGPASGGCSGALFHSAAVSFCEQLGARLCSFQEVLANEATGSGCQYDFERVWTATPCGSNRYWSVAGSTGTLNEHPAMCLDPAQHKWAVRCCADQEAGGSQPACVASTGPSCDDNKPCTDDICVASTGCGHVNNVVPCNDNSLCTTDDQCSNGVCTGNPVSCDDGKPCTLDECFAGSGCKHTNKPLGTNCDDGNTCTTGKCAAPLPGPGDKSCAQLGWTGSGLGTPEICAESEGLIGGCPGKKSHDEALSLCASHGARLCSIGDLLAGEAATTGCNYDSARVWSGTPCTGGYWTSAGAPDFLGDFPMSCTPTTGVYLPVRCCAYATLPPSPICATTGSKNCNDGSDCTFDYCDPKTGCQNVLGDFPCNQSSNLCTQTECGQPDVSTKSCSQLGWADEAGTPKVCGASYIGAPYPQGCRADKTQQQAADACAGVGARLCTLTEILLDETAGTGCGYDSTRVWTSSTCGTNGIWAVAGSAEMAGTTLPPACLAPTATANVRCCADLAPAEVLPACIPASGPDCDDGDDLTDDYCLPAIGCINPLVPGAAAVGDETYMEGQCGDNWCDYPTETKANCPQDCFSKCYGHADLCHRNFLDVTFAGTRQSAEHTPYGSPAFQAASLTTQLNDGIRFFDLELQKCKDWTADNDKYCLCWENCNQGTHQTLASFLTTLASWMGNHPSEVVILDLKKGSGVECTELQTDFDDANLSQYLYSIPKNGSDPYPYTLNNMAKRNLRLIPFSECFVDPQHRFRTKAEMDAFDWPACNDGDGAEPSVDQFYAIDHTRLKAGLPHLQTSMCFNRYKTMKEMANYCGQTRTINTMFVDFYNAQAGPLKIVNYLNGLEHLAIPYTDKLDPYAIGCEMCYTVFDCITMGCMLPDGCAWKGSDFGYQCNGSGPGTWYCAQPTHVAECIENQLCNQPGMICKNDCPVGEYCTADDECEAQKALGMSCVSNRECTSNVCRNNECQECWPVSPFDVLGCNTNGHNTYICADGTCVPTCSTCDEETQNCYASGCGPCADINEACAYDHQCCDYKGDDWDSAVCAHPPIVPCFKSDPGAKCSCLFSFIGSGSCQVELCTCQLLGACAYGWWVYEILSL